MEPHEYARIARRESFYFWHVGRREILREALLRHVSPDASGRQKILDYGCGPGGNILVLKDFGVVSGVDVADPALQFAKTRGFRELVKVDGSQTPFPDNSFDIVASLDVFEHIEDDSAAIRECFRMVKPGGILLTTVPAHRWLWSAHDTTLGHFRRYTKGELQEKIAAAGFETLEWSHFVTVAVPINFVRTVIDRIRKPKAVDTYDIEFSPLVNSLLLLLLRVERMLIRLFPIPVGSSLMMVARKPLK